MSLPSILLVDDDQSIRETFQVQLGERYAVATASSAESAMAMIGSVKPGLVITDLRMGGMSGLELVSWIREALPATDVIVITAHEDMDTAMAAIKAGAYEFLVKPLDLEQLETVIAQCFRDRAVRRRVDRSDMSGDPAVAARRLIGRDPKMIALSKTIGMLTTTRSPVLIRGETGTGKEVVARTIHYNSAAADDPFVAINCTAIPESLLESELFGHVRGAFTGAAADRKGRFELAGKGTIFLDEIGDVSPAFQTKLLRVLQDGEFFPVGAERARRTEARVIAATHRPLEQLVRDGQFREDLYFRLRVVELVIPPLRERRGDIRLIVEALLGRLNRELGKNTVVPDAVMRTLERYDWPGNVRELENALRRAAALARGSVIAVEDLGLDGQAPGSAAPADADLRLATAIRLHATRVLALSGGSKRKAAEVLDVSRARLDRILNGSVGTNRDRPGHETEPDEEDE